MPKRRRDRDRLRRALQQAQQRRRIGRSRVGVLREALLDGPDESARGTAREWCQRGRGLHQMLGEHGRCRLRFERRSPRQRMPGDHAEGIEIARGGGRLAANHLGGEIAWGAEAWLRLDRLECCREAEVAEQHAPGIALDQDVLQGQIAVHHPLGVGVAKRPGDLAQQPLPFVRRQRAATTHPCPQRLPIDQGHHQKWPGALGFDGVDRHDVRVRQPGRRAGLVQEAGARGRIGREVGVQKLDGDRTVQFDVTRQIDRAHAASPELALEGVAAQDGFLQGDEFGGEGHDAATSSKNRASDA